MSETASTQQIVLFESSDGEVSLDVTLDSKDQQVWLNRHQLAVLFGRDVKTIGKHIKNALDEELLGDAESTVANFATVQNEGGRLVERSIEYYTLDVIISVGYRVKSQRGVEFRRWASDVLKRYIIQGRAENTRRIAQLAQAIDVMQRVSDDIDTSQVLEIVKRYAQALELLDDYDHQRIPRPSDHMARIRYIPFVTLSLICYDLTR